MRSHSPVYEACSRALAVLREALLDAFSVLAPVDCAGCGAADRALCAACRQQLTARVSARLLDDGLPVFIGLSYEGIVRRTILAFKRQGRTDVARALAAPLAAAVAAALDTTSRGAVELVTVPSTRSAFRSRGYDPVALLVRKAALPRTSGVLVYERVHAQQKSLGREARRQNLAGTMLATQSLRGRVFIVIDDVVTTGATLAEAARAIRAAGGEILAAVAVANTPQLLGHFGSSRRKLVTSPDVGTTVSKRGAQVVPGSAGGDAPR